MLEQEKKTETDLKYEYGYGKLNPAWLNTDRPVQLLLKITQP